MNVGMKRGARALVALGTCLGVMFTGDVLAPGVRVVPAARVVRPGPVRSAPVRLVVWAKRLGRVSPYLFGANLLWPYDAEGAFDTATGHFYPGFVEEVRSLGVTALRYPAGITSDSFDWMRAIGPQATRGLNEPYGVQGALSPKPCCTLDAPVPSTVGPDQFGQLLGQIGAIGTVTVNFDTGDAKEAADFVAYMTAPYTPHPSPNPKEPSYWAGLRAKNGHPRPYDVPYWEVGNEQDGPGQFGWRAGKLVKMGQHNADCPAWETPVCLYAFGGTTAFTRQRVGTFADEEPSSALSTGRPHQSFYVYFPPVVPNSQQIFVGSHKWAPVEELATAGPHARVYQFNPRTGRILFGNGRHGAVPPRDDEVTVTYQSGPHDGFVQFYAAMKKMGPHIHVCEAEEENVAFLQVMGRAYPYDCVELHKYAKPMDVHSPMTDYEERLMATPLAEGARLSALQAAVRHYAGRDVPIVLTEYGQLVEPMPSADPDFNLSLDESLLVASQLTQWIDHRLPLAEKYLLNSVPFLGEYRLSSNIDVEGLSVDSAMIAGLGPPFILEPTGEVMHLMSQLAGAQRLRSMVMGDPVMEPGRRTKVPVLEATVASSNGLLDILVINTSPLAKVKAQVDLNALEHGRRLLATLLDGPSPLAYNTLDHPDEVTSVARFAEVNRGNFEWAFPAHSVTLLQLSVPVAHAQR